MGLALINNFDGELLIEYSLKSVLLMAIVTSHLERLLLGSSMNGASQKMIS